MVKAAQAEEKIAAEVVGGHHLVQVPIGRRHQAKIAFHFAGAAQGAEAALLQDAEKGFLQRKRQLPDLVEEQGTAVRLPHQPFLRFFGAGEGAFFMTEQKAFGQRFRQGGAIDDDEILRRRAGCCWWMARANSSLPVPVSPVIRMLASLPAACATWFRQARSFGLLPKISSRFRATTLCFGCPPSFPAGTAGHARGKGSSP